LQVGVVALLHLSDTMRFIGPTTSGAYNSGSGPGAGWFCFRAAATLRALLRGGHAHCGAHGNATTLTADMLIDLAAAATSEGENYCTPTIQSSAAHAETGGPSNPYIEIDISAVSSTLGSTYTDSHLSLVYCRDATDVSSSPRITSIGGAVRLMVSPRDTSDGSKTFTAPLQRRRGEGRYVCFQGDDRSAYKPHLGAICRKPGVSTTVEIVAAYGAYSLSRTVCTSVRGADGKVTLKGTSDLLVSAIECRYAGDTGTIAQVVSMS
jgi:hypothetical protein